MIRKQFLVAALLAGCATPDSAPDGATAPVTATTTAAVVSPGVKDVPAVNHALYPDNIGYLYEGSLAKVLWLQNVFNAQNRDDLADRLGRGMARGLSGEFVTSQMQQVAPLGHATPSLATMATHTVQSVRLLAQYSFTSRDYPEQLAGSLATFNADPARLQAVVATTARINTALSGLGTVAPGGPLPAPPPPPNRGPVVPGRFFSDAVHDGQRVYLQKRTRALQQAIGSRDAARYGAAFPDVFLAQLDPNLRDGARKALAVNHVDAVLKGQPLDAVIAKYVLAAPDLALTMEQLRLINQINLIANQIAAVKQPLVAALLLLDLDRRLGESDAQLSCDAIWAHVHDLTWLVAQYVRVKADGTTTQAALDFINNIVANNIAP